MYIHVDDVYKGWSVKHSWKYAQRENNMYIVKRILQREIKLVTLMINHVGPQRDANSWKRGIQRGIQCARKKGHFDIETILTRLSI